MASEAKKKFDELKAELAERHAKLAYLRLALCAAASTNRHRSQVALSAALAGIVNEYTANAALYDRLETLTNWAGEDLVEDQGSV